RHTRFSRDWSSDVCSSDLEAVRRSSHAVIVVHNHPSGDATPSASDIALTRRLREAGELLGITLLDHIVIGDTTFTSLKEAGYWRSEERRVGKERRLHL